MIVINFKNHIGVYRQKVFFILESWVHCSEKKETFFYAELFEVKKGIRVLVGGDKIVN